MGSDSNKLISLEAFLLQANREIVSSSPGLNKVMVKRTLDLIRNRQLAGIGVKVLTLPGERYPENRIEITKELITELKQSGIDIRLKAGLHEHFAVADREIVWYGSLSLLSGAKEDLPMTAWKLWSEALIIS